MLKEVDGFQNWLKYQNSTYATQSQQICIQTFILVQEDTV